MFDWLVAIQKAPKMFRKFTSKWVVPRAIVSFLTIMKPLANDFYIALQLSVKDESAYICLLQVLDSERMEAVIRKRKECVHYGKQRFI